MIEPGFTAIPASTVCLDCGAPISGNYCANCGQETRIETPTVRQFAHEMMDQYVAVEGKLGRTLRVLLTRPGQLTLDYVEGRRQRYVRPLKLYVTISVVFFTLLGVLPDSLSPFMSGDAARKQAQKEAKADMDRDELKQVKEVAAARVKAARAKAEEARRKPLGGDMANVIAGKNPDTGADEDAGKAAGDVAGEDDAKDAGAAKAADAEQPAADAAPADLREQIKQQVDAAIKSGDSTDADVHRQVDDALHKEGLGGSIENKAKAFASLAPEQQSRALREKLADDAPYAMFFLLPYFAFLLRVLYRKNKLRYGVHLLFSVHLHCFMFIVLALGFLLMIGTVLIAEGFGFHIEKGYIYAAMAFAAFIEALQMFARGRAKKSGDHH